MPRKSQGTRTNQSHKDQVIPAKFRAGFLSDLDGRTELAKALRANYDEIVSDIGGVEEVGHIKGALVERFVWLEGMLQSIEHDMANGTLPRADAISKWVQAVNSLTGLAKVLGVELHSTSRPWIEPASNGDSK